MYLCFVSALVLLSSRSVGLTFGPGAYPVHSSPLTWRLCLHTAVGAMDALATSPGVLSLLTGGVLPLASLEVQVFSPFPFPALVILAMGFCVVEDTVEKLHLPFCPPASQTPLLRRCRHSFHFSLFCKYAYTSPSSCVLILEIIFTCRRWRFSSDTATSHPSLTLAVDRSGIYWTLGPCENCPRGHTTGSACLPVKSFSLVWWYRVPIINATPMCSSMLPSPPCRQTLVVIATFLCPCFSHHPSWGPSCPAPPGKVFFF